MAVTEPSTVFTVRIFIFDPDPQATLDGGYDQYRLERRLNKKNAVFKDITHRVGGELEITAATFNYFFVDEKGGEEFVYRPVLIDSTGVKPDINQSERKGVNTEFESIMTVEELKMLYLFGLDLTNDEGVPYPDSLYVHYILKGIDDLERNLDIRLLPQRFDERHDFYRRDYEHYMFLRLREYPIIQVDEIALDYPAGENIISFDKSWFRVDKDGGTVQVLPARGTFTQLLITAAGGFLPVVFGGSDFIPDIIKVVYFAGFELGKLPTNLKDMVGKYAAMGPLNIAGDLLGGAGIASQSIGIDGLSQSFNTTSSATNAGYGARLIRYDKEIKDQMPKLRSYYKGITMTAV